MATDITSIFNLALGACGARSSVAIYTEESREAKLCREWYDHVRELVLAAAPWPEATAYFRLNLQAERDDSADWVLTDPGPGWLYSHAQPSGCVRPRNFTTFAKFQPGVSDAGVPVIYSSEYDPVLCYTKDLTNPALWKVGLRDAIIFTLAAHIVDKLTGTSNKGLKLIAVAEEKVMNARAIAGNMDSGQLPESIPEWISARGYAESSPSTGFIYPPADFGTSSLALAK